MVNLRTVSTRRWLRWTKVHIISVTARTVASKAVNPMASREYDTTMHIAVLCLMENLHGINISNVVIF